MLPVTLTVTSGITATDCYTSRWADGFQKIANPPIAGGILLQRGSAGRLGLNIMNILKQSGYIRVTIDAEITRATVTQAGDLIYQYGVVTNSGVNIQGIKESPVYTNTTAVDSPNMHYTGTILLQGGVDYTADTENIDVILFLTGESTGRANIAIEYNILVETMGRNNLVEPDPDVPADEIIMMPS